MEFWAVFFHRWYLGAFLAIWGSYLALRAKPLNDIRDLCDDPSDELKLVLERRQQLESRPIVTWYITAATSIALGVATLCGLVNGGLAYALTCVVLVVAHTVGYLRMRNSSRHRAAALIPRRVDSIIAWPWYPAGLLVALTPLAFLDLADQRVASVIVAVSAFAIMLLAIRANGMPAMLTGDHPDLELYVDQRLRRLRVQALWTVGIGVPFVFVVMTVVGRQISLLQGFAYCVDFAALIACYWRILLAKARRLVNT